MEKLNLKEQFYNYLCLIRNKNKESESIYNFEADRGKFNRIIDRISGFFNYNLFEVSNDYSDVAILLENVERDFKLLKTQDEKYIEFNKNTERGIPNSIINKHYFNFLDQLNPEKKTATFVQLIENLRRYFLENNIPFKLLGFKPKQQYVWIADKNDVIGNQKAHYEVITDKKNRNQIFVDIHFEGNKKEKDIFHQTLTTLPDNLKWIDWAGSKSIRYSENFEINEFNIEEKIVEAIEYMDKSIGNEIRTILKGLPAVTDATAEEDDESKTQKQPLNQILYGPPGTGKTFNTINKALELIGETIDGKTRQEIKDLFDDKVNEGQIIFSTFHQNMSYEDFIEGIKPKTTIEGNVTYEIENGIFKNICIKASEKKTVVDFDDAYSKFVDDILITDFIDLETPVQNKPFKVKINSNKTAVAIPNTEKATEMGVTKDMLKDYIINGVIKDWKPYTTSIGEYFKSNYPVTVENIDYTNKKYVIIIDEINRGNVSKIFGELITLIEESKRTGRSEAISAVLPYSKEEFSVPDNVYILGTMNTADRSVEALDTALRRRFDFIEMMPDYSLSEINYKINNISVSDILKTINKRIEVLLGRDHLIGHSFFILDENENIDNKVKSAFSKNIIPLLQEYFYGDYNKIGLVLGSRFVSKTRIDNSKKLFADSHLFNGNDYLGNETFTYSITEFQDDKSFYNALEILMNITSSSETDE